MLQEERTCDATRVTRLDSPRLLPVAVVVVAVATDVPRFYGKSEQRVADPEVNRTVWQCEVNCNYWRRKSGKR